MRTVLTIIAFIMAMVSLPAQAEDKTLGVGFVLGEPTALSGKYLPSRDHSYDLQISINSREYFLVYGDYLFNFPNLFRPENEFLRHLTPYAGVGPMFAFGSGNHDKGQYFDKRTDSVAIGARVPFGAEWMWDRAPIGIGFELVPGIVIIPATTGILQAGLSFRFYF